MPLIPTNDPGNASLRKELNEIKRNIERLFQATSKAGVRIGNATPKPVRSLTDAFKGHPGTSPNAAREDHTHAGGAGGASYEAVFHFYGDADWNSVSLPYRIPATGTTILAVYVNASGVNPGGAKVLVNGQIVSVGSGGSDRTFNEGDLLTVMPTQQGQNITVQVSLGV